MAKEWSSKEITYLKRYAASKSLAELAQRMEAEEPEVLAKLGELGLSAKDSEGRTARLGNEPLLEVYEKGLKALYGGKRAEAEKLLAKVAEECDQPELSERARQLLAVVRAPKSDGPESEDPFLLAVYEKNRGNYSQALEISKKGGRSGKDERFAYLEASIHALEDRLDDAAGALDKAIELNQKNRVHAFHDPDFAALRASDEHGEIFA
jgi:tetratricopeptide (TPR) repeat protein